MMTPSEINEAVARGLGWKKHNKTCEILTPGASIYTFGNHWYHEGYACREVMPNYCGSIEAAWEVVEDVSKNHEISVGWVGDSWSCLISDEPIVRADTPAMAICLAYLKLQENK